MWTTILSAVPWSTIFAFAIQLILLVVKKSNDHKEAEEAFLKFISDIKAKGNIPVKISDKYMEQIEALRVRLKEEKLKDEGSRPVNS